MTQLGFHIDVRYCTGCLTCVMACKDKNNLGVGALFRRVSRIEGGEFPHPWGFYLSMACNHCTEPPCVCNCPTGAMQKREKDGIVFVDKDKCIGCRYCMWSCPYGAINYIEEEGKVGKCNFCMDLIDQGLTPACVDACPMRILHFGDLDELKAIYGDTSDIVGLPDSSITRPSVVITPKPVAVKSVA